MKTYQERAEAYVRQQLPELMELSFGCEFKPKNSEGGHRKVIKVINEYSRGITYTTIYYVSHLAKETPASIGINDFEDMCQIIGHPIQLQHWLKAIPTYIPYFIETVEASDITTIRLSRRDGQDKPVWFNLTTGQPASEKDYQMFCTLVGVE